ncbi:MAG: hypothetical protein COB67_00315 [SAR324 cluster bacterium]|uniref:Transglycosylase SLT domain-containing protein n=1 Tax=SAR324 cluster bacterium TaxID=2024889 RepID=A0A2A4TBN5_9DELT|nr:MAG: hypothetical protein COB67_00315 [SAR324 cluster bacterium]
MYKCILILILIFSNNLFAQKVNTMPAIKQYKDEIGLSKDDIAIHLDNASRNELWIETNQKLNILYKNRFMNRKKVRELAPIIIESFAKIVIKDPSNIVAAYEGATSLALLYGFTGKMTKEYLTIFTQSLMDNNICIGYIYLAQAHAKGKLETGKSYKMAYRVLSRGKSACSTQYVPINQIDAYGRALSRARYFSQRSR